MDVCRKFRCLSYNNKILVRLFTIKYTLQEMKKRVCTLLLLSLIFAIGNELLLANSTYAIPSGRYYIARENLTGSEFADFDYFEIRSKITRSVTLYRGRLFAKTSDGYAEFTLRKIRVIGKQLNFETSLVNGVHFTFEGHFLVQWQKKSAGSCPIVLQGKLKEIDKREGIMENDFGLKYMPFTNTGSCP